MLMEISDDIKPIVCSDPYKLNVVGQVCQRGCPVHEYFHSKLFPKFSVCYYYKTFCVKLPCMYNAIFDSLRLADVVELQLIVLVKLHIFDGYHTTTLHMSSFEIV